MKKIIFLIETLGGGGAEKVLLDIVKNIDKDQFDVTVQTIVDNGIYDKEIKKYCNYDSYLKIDDLNKGIFKKLIYKIKYKLIYKLPPKIVYKLLIKKKYDIEVAFVEGYVTKVIGNSKLNSTNKIAWVHVDPIQRDYADLYFRNLEHQALCYNNFNKVICVSNSVKASFEQKFGNSNEVLVQYNPIDKNNIFLKKDEKIDFKDSNSFKLITVGRLVEQKGYDRLLRVCNKLIKEDGLNFELYILGEGPLKDNLQAYILENNLSENIYLCGFKKNPYKYMKKCDLFVCSSRAEGFSLVIAESMCMGIPVISTNCSGPNELLDDGKYGMLVENNEESLYLGIKEILKNPKLLDVYRKSIDTIKDRFDINTIIKEIEVKLSEF